MSRPDMVRMPNDTAACEAVIKGGASACTVNLTFTARGVLAGVTPHALSNVLADGERELARRLRKLDATLQAYGSIQAVQHELVTALALANRLADLEREHGHKAEALIAGGA